MLPVIPVFPILLLTIKFVSIFNHGSEWKKISDVVTMFEGQVEAYLQVGLQCYIILTRPDRSDFSIELGGSSNLWSSRMVVCLVT